MVTFRCVHCFIHCICRQSYKGLHDVDKAELLARYIMHLHELDKKHQGVSCKCLASGSKHCKEEMSATLLSSTAMSIPKLLACSELDQMATAVYTTQPATTRLQVQPAPVHPILQRLMKLSKSIQAPENIVNFPESHLNASLLWAGRESLIWV